MIHNQQGHPLHFGRREKSEHSLALPMRPQSREEPSLIRDLALAVEHLQQPLVALRLRLGSPLRLLDNLSRVVLREDRSCKRQRQGERHRVQTRSTMAGRQRPITHTPAPPRATSGRLIRQARGPKKKAPAKIAGSSISGIRKGNRYADGMPDKSRPVICSRKYRFAAPNNSPRASPTSPMATASIHTVCRI